MTTRRKFLTTAAIAGPAALAAPAVHAQSVIKWRMQTYAGPALAEHVIKPAIDSFNKVAEGQMEIELFFADQLGPHRRAVPCDAARHHRRGAVG